MSDPEDELLADLAGGSSAIDVAVAEASAWIGDGVEGVGEGRTDNGEPCLVVFVSSLDPAVRDRIPTAINGYPVILSSTDAFRAEAGEVGEAGGE